MSGGQELGSWTDDQHAAANAAGELIELIDNTLAGTTATAKFGVDSNGTRTSHLVFALPAAHERDLPYAKEADVWSFGERRLEPFGVSLGGLRDPAYASYRHLRAASVGRISLQLGDEREEYHLYNLPNSPGRKLGIVVASTEAKIISDVRAGPVTVKERLDKPRWTVGRTPWNPDWGFTTRWIVDRRGMEELADTVQFFIRHGDYYS
jgi:hypothetical protein